jgi:phosphatidylglycerophosphatase A
VPTPARTPRGTVIERRSGPAVWIATCGGTGYFPVAPGTAGSAVGLVLVVALHQVPFATPWLVVSLAVVAGLLFVLGVWAAGKAEKFFGRVDPAQVVIDEVVGQMITLLAWPRAPWKWLLAGFVLFRIFDVVKPFPARRAERIGGGWGIMLDDVVAGVYGLAALMVLGYRFK